MRALVAVTAVTIAILAVPSLAPESNMATDTETGVITGSSRGIGFGYAREFVRRGHRVLISGRQEADVASAVEKLASESSVEQVRGQTCDISDIAQVQSLWDAGQHHYNRVDIWINNAGFARTGPDLLGLSPNEIETMVETNVVGTMNGCQVAVAGFEQQSGGGRIFNTLGGGAKGRVVKGMIGYSTTKRAIHYFSKALAKQTKDQPEIRLGTVSPGINITEGMLREIKAMPDGERARMKKALNFIGDHVETTTPWIVDQMLSAEKRMVDITWLSNGRMMRRALSGLVGGKRDVLSRYGV